MKYSTRALGRFALRHVVVAALGLACSTAWGLGLGRLNVQSALGETLKAEIDVTSLSPDEAGSLKVRVAPPESYRSSGVEYNAVLTGTQVQLARRADGTPYLRVASDRAVQEPFVDLILELNWSSGRLVREFTLLFDPPSNPKPTPTPAPVTTSPVASAAPAAPVPLTAAAPAAVAAAPAPTPAPTPASSTSASTAPSPSPRQLREPSPPALAPAARAKPEAAPRSAAPSSASASYAVQPGDSLSKVASKLHPPSVSLDQMLVGLYRSNPDAFVDNNMNRLKAGAVLQVPTEDEAASLTHAQARQIIKAQSADFGGYRQRLASDAPALKQDESARRDKGRVQAAVEDRKPAAASAPDKLTLSKANGSAAELRASKASKEAEKKEAAARMAELTRNVEELKKLSNAAKPVVPAASSATPAPLAASALKPASASVNPAPTTVSAASAASAPPLTASAPAVIKPPAGLHAASAPASAASAPLPALHIDEPDLTEQLLSNPLVLPLGGGLIALLGALGLYRLRSRKQAARLDTSFNESRLQPDSFFGASGGQRVDTRDGSAGASSMSYSLSQLDAIGDVDPVAEADVYLAYGRDLQAEEILKEALRSDPERLAIRLKLLEVYAKRRDTRGFEQLAIQLHAETQGEGEDWAHAQELGRQIDPDNPLYQPGGEPNAFTAPADSVAASVLPEPAPAEASAQAAQAEEAAEAVDAVEAPAAAPLSGFDLDLDLDLAAPPAVVPAPSPISMDATQAMAVTIEQAPLEMDFDVSGSPSAAVEAVEPAASNDIDFDLDLPDLSAPAGSAAAPTAAALDFDLASIDLDLPDTPAPAAAPQDDALPDFDEMFKIMEASPESDPPVPAAPAEAEPDEPDHLANALEALQADDGDPLMRQLELADEFRQIGDTEGARDVLNELISKASGPLRDKAQAMLDELR